jgi:predicted GNAT family acetyltransferase
MEPEVFRNEVEQRYELRLDEVVVGVADYREHGGTVVMPHTSVDPSHRGQGLAAVLVRGALNDLRARGATVDPQCWYVAEFISANSDYADLLSS